MKNHIITQAEYDFLIDRLAKLKKDDEIALKDLKHALNYGSETWHDNDMYDTAKTKQINLDKEKKEIQQILKSAKVIVPEEMSSAKVGIGNRVRLENTDNKETMTINIGGSEATRLGEGWISLTSPLGEAIKNQTQGSIVILKLPEYDVHYKILDIESI